MLIVTIIWTTCRTYLRIVDPQKPANNWGIISPVDGQLAIRPELKKILQTAGTYNERFWLAGPGRHSGVATYEHSNCTPCGACPERRHHCVDCAVGYLARSLGQQGIAIFADRI